MRHNYLDGGFCQAERGGQLAPLWAGHVILFKELLLQAIQLILGERRPVSPDFTFLCSFWNDQNNEMYIK